MSTTRIKTFESILKAMFEQIEPAFKERMIADFRGLAERQGKFWETKKTEAWPDESKLNWRAKDELRRKALPGQYVKLKKDHNNDSVLLNLRDNAQWWEHIKLLSHTIDYALAEKNALDVVASAKSHFIVKQSRKLDNACAKHPKAKPAVGGSLTLSNPITGLISVKLKEGLSFALNMSIIVNCRYNNRKGSTTYFNQFPSRFSDVIKDGQPVKSPSEAWMAENF
jgi:hypothetical protein